MVVLEARGVRTHPFELSSERCILDSQGLGSFFILDYGARPRRLSTRFFVPFWRTPVGMRMGQGAPFAMLAFSPYASSASV